MLEAERPLDDEQAGLLVEGLLSLSGRGVEEQGGRLIAYFDPVQGEPAEIVRAIRDRFRGEAGGSEVQIAYRWQDHQDWVGHWRRGLRPRRVGRRLLVSPTWIDALQRPGDLLILLDPGIAFGTSEHASTRGCLRLLEQQVAPGERIVDVGAGSGILSIAAALLGASRAISVDVDPWACRSTRENAELNGVADRVEVIEADVGTDFVEDVREVDGIVANIELGALTPMLAGFRLGLRPGGWLILGGIQVDEAERVLGAAEGAGFEPTRNDIEDGWWSGAFSAS